MQALALQEVEMEVLRQVEPRIYYQAEAFHIAAITLYESDTMKYRGAPFIVNASFALELYLKCLDGQTIFDKPSEYSESVTQYERVYSKGAQKGHQLSSLFESLSCEYKDKIANQFYAVSNGLPADKFFVKYNKHFVSWRYGFEGNNDGYVAAEILAMLSVLQAVGNVHL